MQTNCVYPIGVALLFLAVAFACDSNDDDDDTEPTTTNDDDSTPAPDDDDTLPDDDDTTGTTEDDDCPNGHLTETACPELIDPVGDLSCLGQNPDPEPGEGTVIVSGVVRDFQSEVPVPGAFLEVHGTEFTATSAPDGTFELEVPADQRVHVRAEATGYIPTWNYGFLAGSEEVELHVGIVAESTFGLIPRCTFGPCYYWIESACILAGQVTDCTGAPLGGYGISVSMESCAHPEGAVKWFKGGFPNATQCPASNDGLFGVLYVNPPLATVSVMGASGEVLLESDPLPCEAGALGLLNFQIH